jgi:hypothetical protein
MTGLDGTNGKEYRLHLAVTSGLTRLIAIDRHLLKSIHIDICKYVVLISMELMESIYVELQLLGYLRVKCNKIKAQIKRAISTRRHLFISWGLGGMHEKFHQSPGSVSA